ncbi:hypothetical protein [Streptomyces sp. NBC_01618]|nr:hypothetical protein OH735_31360 [Streptomyces sp. NBC_01618]
MTDFSWPGTRFLREGGVPRDMSPVDAAPVAYVGNEWVRPYMPCE